MTGPAVTWNFQWSAPSIVKLWNEGPDGIVSELEQAYQLGYRVGMWRFPRQFERKQAGWEFVYGAQNGLLYDLVIAIEQWTKFHPDFELIVYLPPDPTLDCVYVIQEYKNRGFTLAFDRVPKQNSPAGLLIRAIGHTRPDRASLIEPWWGGEADHGAFYQYRCVATWTEYQNRLQDGKRLDEGPMPDMWVMPDAKDWPAIGSRHSLVEFCGAIATDDLEESRLFPMLPLDVVVAQKFDARLYGRVWGIGNPSEVKKGG